MEITSGIHQIQVTIPDNPLGHLNTYIVEGKEGWLLIDTGWPSPKAFDALKAGIKGLGLAFSDISKIILTHSHPDHYSLAGHIKKSAPQIELLTHPLEGVLIEWRYSNYPELREKTEILLRRYGVPEEVLIPLRTISMPGGRFMRTILPDRFMYGGEIISTGIYDLEIIWTPGHSPGHICLYEPENRLLFSGDHILPITTPNVSYHLQSGDNPLGDYKHALQKLRHLPVDRVLPGHEHIFNDLNKRIGEITEHHEKREAEIGRAIEKKPLNAYEISSMITWDLPDRSWEQFPALHKRFAVSETIAHLEFMRWEGRVEKTDGNDVILWSSSRL
ncbi:MAG: MBL fold metallo-hydrolase [Deltaproteobacteria bacterium]|nr:MBL fold metallo-hydrolase [Deltaproteobacteria bacterium]